MPSLRETISAAAAGYISRALGVEERAAPTADKPALSSAWSRSTAAGVTVSDDVALSYAAMWACVGLIAETVASLPLNVYRRMPDGSRERQDGHPLQAILHDAWNPEVSALNAREAVQLGLLMRGNGYAAIERQARGRIVALWPLRSDRMTVTRDAEGRLVYTRSVDGRSETYQASSILHIPGLSWDGVSGKSPLDAARDAIGLGVASQEYGSRFFGSGTHPSAVVKHPGRLSQKAFDNLKSSLDDRHAGLGKAHRLMLLEEGMDFREIGVSPEQAQFLETRRFQRSEIAAIYRVPLVLIDSTASTTWGTGVEQLMIGFVTYCLRPWLVRWEQALNMQLLTAAERSQGYYCEHVVDGLLRGDIASRYSAYATGRQWGWLSADDVRRLENMDPLPDGAGAEYLRPMNMAQAGSDDGGASGS